MRLKWHLVQVGRALSRLFNALSGGEGDTTTSANSYKLMLEEKTKLFIPGKYWVSSIDYFLGPNHCEESYYWHKLRKLFDDDL